MRTVLITGAMGQIGYELTQRLGEWALAKPRDLLDVSKADDVRSCFSELKPDIVVHAAGFSSYRPPEISYTYRDRCWRTQVDGTANVTKTCIELGLPLVHISSHRVFGSQIPGKPSHELDAPAPVGQMACAKVAAEHALLMNAMAAPSKAWSAGFRYWILRAGYAYERPWRAARHLPALLSSWADARRPPELSTRVKTSFVYVPHFVNSLLWLFNNQGRVRDGIYHVANEGAVSLCQFGEAWTRLMKAKYNVIPTSELTNEWDLPQDTSLDCQRWSKLGAPPLPNWLEGLREYCVSARKAIAA